MIRISLALMSFILLTTLRPEDAAAAEILFEADTGRVLHAEEADVLWHPASLTKLMTVLLALEALADEELELSDLLPVSAEAAGQPPTQVGLTAGQRISVDDAVSATIMRSANDAAVVLAEALAGSVEGFTHKMNARAAQLGMIATSFHNATGLPDSAQVTTARDMAVLARHILVNHPAYAGFFRDTAMTLQGKTLVTINGFLRTYPGATGMKTGFTCASGYNIVASVRRGARVLVGVLLGARSSATRAARIARLMDNPEPGAFAGTESPLILADFIRAAPENPPGPRTVIGPGDCMPESTPRVADHDSRLPGWGILLGAFNGREQAEAAAERYRKGVAASATSIVLQRRQGRVRGFSALLVNLTRSEAQNACSTLRRSKAYCLTLGPKALNNPRALWR